MLHLNLQGDDCYIILNTPALGIQAGRIAVLDP